MFLFYFIGKSKSVHKLSINRSVCIFLFIIVTQIMTILPLVIDDFFELFLNHFLLFEVWFVNIFDGFMIWVLEESQIILETQIDEVITTFFKVFHFSSFITDNRVKDSIVRLRWRSLFWSHDSSKSLHHLSSGTFVHRNFDANIRIR